VDNRPIGFFDSGVGGLTIWRATRRLLPHERLIFVADRSRFPYGERSPEELCDLSRRMTRFLLSHDAKLIVVACNTASVHALAYLRASFPEMPFVGVVPVVKTLARRTRTGTIAVLSTPATAESSYLGALIEQFASGKQVINIGCEGLGEMIEAGAVSDARTRALLERYLRPVAASNADVVGLGCTHYPFLRRAMKRLLGPGVRVYDPARPVARRVQQLLAERDGFACQAAPGKAGPPDCLYTTGDPQEFAKVVRRLLRHGVPEVEFIEL
jgi:glutamate racemase